TGEERRHESLWSTQRRRQQYAVPRADTFEARFKTLLEAHERIAGTPRRNAAPDMAFHGVMAAHEKVGHRGDQRTRQDERADQGEHDSLGQRPEQIAGDAA